MISNETMNQRPVQKAPPGGLRAWWLRLTAPPGAAAYEQSPSRAVRERLRRAGLTSAVAPFVAIAPLLLSAQAKVDASTAASLILLPLIVAFALLLNRFGQQTIAAIVLVLGMDIVVEGALITAGTQGGLGAGWLLTFDLFVIPLIAVGLLLSRQYLWIFAALHIAFILGDFYLLPHSPDLGALVHQWNGDAIAYARPVLIQIVGAVLSFVSVRSTDQAIIRADRAEQIAQLEHQVAEQRRQLEYGVQQLLQTHVRLANGDFSARTPQIQDNYLWQVGQSLNNLIARMQHAVKAEFQLRRVEDELQRLASALDDARMGRPPIWPAPAGTPVDPIVDRLSGRRPAGSPPSVAPPAAPQRAQWSDQLPPRGGYDGYGDNQPSRQGAPRQAGDPYENPWGQR